MRKLTTILAALSLFALPQIALAANAASGNGASGNSGTGSANGSAMDNWKWSGEQEHTFYGSFATMPNVVEAPNFNMTVGGEVPADVQLYEVPSSYSWAPARDYRYVWANKRVYVIDPGTRHVVRIIER